jgi:peptide chain release factor 1
MRGLEEIKKRYAQIKELLKKEEEFFDWEKIGKLQKEKEFCESILQKEEELKKIQEKLEENKKIQEKENDVELLEIARQENEALKKREAILKKEIEKKLAQRNEEDISEAVIVEIRAGAGGEEAALFAADLFKMYSKYADSKNWQVKILDSHPTELGGFKEIIFEIKGKGAFSQLKYEGGVHRVQRIPDTEKAGRIHTSTATVAILPKPKKAQIRIHPDDLKIETFRASGPGGQYVNRRETAVRITHLPTGLVVASQTQRNQLQNKENALAILEARLMEKEREKKAKEIERKRVSQIKRAKRAEKIRTYNFPQNRVTDHRIKKSWHNIERIMEGELEPIIKALKNHLNNDTADY